MSARHAASSENAAVKVSSLLTASPAPFLPVVVLTVKSLGHVVAPLVSSFVQSIVFLAVNSQAGVSFAEYPSLPKP